MLRHKSVRYWHAYSIMRRLKTRLQSNPVPCYLQMIYLWLIKFLTRFTNGPTQVSVVIRSLVRDCVSNRSRARTPTQQRTSNRAEDVFTGREIRCKTSGGVMRYAQTKLHYICGFIFYDARHTRHVCTHRRCRRSMGSTTPASADTDACPSMKIDYGVRSKTQLLLVLVFVLVVCTVYFQVRGTGILAAVL